MNKTHNYKLLRFLPCFFYLALIAYLSLMPQQEMPKEISDKLLHATAYAGASALWAWASIERRWRIATIPALIGYGILLEGAQALTPDRFADVNDAIANAIGVISGFALFLLCARSSTLARWFFFPKNNLPTANLSKTNLPKTDLPKTKAQSR
jgi:VanZ family protein